MPQVDRAYCASSFLMFRAIMDRRFCFADGFPLSWGDLPAVAATVNTGLELEQAVRSIVQQKTAGRKCALALSGGMDSAILLSMMPPDTIAYTFECVVDGVRSTQEYEGARRYLDACGCAFEHKVVPITWEDTAALSIPLMRRKGAPIHSIEVQIYKAALQAVRDGCDLFVFGETADCLYGGHSMMLAHDWAFGAFVDRFTFVPPHHVLRAPSFELRPFAPYVQDGMVDVPRFLAEVETPLSYNSYWNACGLAGIEFFAPYAHTRMGSRLDLARVRRGENKYLIREAFGGIYPDFDAPEKKPMPRPMGEWLRDWGGPSHPDFWPHCTADMTGDQKWLVWALERFLKEIDKGPACGEDAG